MEKDKATKERLLESARREFLEKGYMKASLRTICKNAGVTTGVLYFFFQDKADLYERRHGKRTSEKSTGTGGSDDICFGYRNAQRDRNDRCR